MSLPLFTLHQPESLPDALRCARDLDGSFDFMAGGTDLLPAYTQRLNTRRNVISLTGIKSLTRLSSHTIGACVTLADLIRYGKELPPVIHRTASLIAGPAIRESATVGGNLLLSGRCNYYNQSPLYRCAIGPCLKADGEACLVVKQKETCYAIASGDLAPVFLALGAHFNIAGPDGERLVNASDFYCPNGLSSTILGACELLTEIVLPKDVFDFEVDYVKLRPRTAVDFPQAGVAVAVKRNGSKQRNGLIEVRVALGALGPSPVVTMMTKDEVGHRTPEQIAEQVWKKLAPRVMAIRNGYYRPSYRKAMAKHYLVNLLKKLIGSRG